MKIGNKTILYTFNGNLVSDIKDLDMSAYKITAVEKGRNLKIYHFKPL